MGSLRYLKGSYFVDLDGKLVDITGMPTITTLAPEPKMSAGIIIEDGDETRIYELLKED